MKKIYIVIFNLFILFLLTGCSNIYKIKNNIYLTTIAIEVDNDTKEFIVYEYYIASADVGKNESANSNSFGVFKARDKNLASALNKCEKGITQKIHYSTIKTILFHDSFLSEKNLALFNAMIKKMLDITYNFYILYTEESISALFNTVNPDNTSSLYNIFSYPRANNYMGSNVEPLHFLDYIRYFHLDFVPIKFPVLGISESQYSEAGNLKVTVQVLGVCYYNNDKKVLFTEEEEIGFYFLFDQESILIFTDEFDVDLKNFKYKLKMKDNKFLIQISYEISIVDNQNGKSIEEIHSFVSEYIKEHINIILKLSDEFKMDFLKLNYELYKKNKEIILEFNNVDLIFKITNKNY